jgi:hypothetical protein
MRRRIANSKDWFRAAVPHARGAIYAPSCRALVRALSSAETNINQRRGAQCLSHPYQNSGAERFSHGNLIGPIDDFCSLLPVTFRCRKADREAP